MLHPNWEIFYSLLGAGIFLLALGFAWHLLGRWLYRRRIKRCLRGL